ncbi:hypothetical protein [Streptomyces cavernicola]|uniref:Energy-coupling factor transporter transmembrane protein EcfT n=1 Tax=Streptomyces cavernicola TaxID=3043613 RepID=A0ABT6S9A2_9ACTN|nr:hypothetical protein [Streptomyces sp. B-S-A6]MDI3403871.1 hypothetical protein [Streptomyces sp. B-S-A6]
MPLPAIRSWPTSQPRSPHRPRSRATLAGLVALAVGAELTMWPPPPASVLLLALILVTLVSGLKRVHRRVLIAMADGV